MLRCRPVCACSSVSPSSQLSGHRSTDVRYLVWASRKSTEFATTAFTETFTFSREFLFCLPVGSRLHWDGFALLVALCIQVMQMQRCTFWHASSYVELEKLHLRLFVIHHSPPTSKEGTCRASQIFLPNDHSFRPISKVWVMFSYVVSALWQACYTLS